MLRSRLRELANQRRRFGYRRLHLLLKREGVAVNPQEAVPALPRGAADRPPARRTQARDRHAGAYGDPAGPEPALVRRLASHDVLSDGRRFRIFAAVDDFTRECLALTVDTSISGARVVRELQRITELRGRPCMIVSDNGTELTSNAVLAWSEESLSATAIDLAA